MYTMITSKYGDLRHEEIRHLRHAQSSSPRLKHFSRKSEPI